MKKQRIVTMIAAIVLALIAVNALLRAEYRRKTDELLYGEGFGYGETRIEQILESFYLRKGEFPQALVIGPETMDWAEDTLACVHNVATTSGVFADPFASTKDRVVPLEYHPIYNRHNGRREAFILLSAGVDGNMDNRIADTLYLDSWWRQLEIYNLGEVMAMAFGKQAYTELAERKIRHKGHVGGNAGEGITRLLEENRSRFSLPDYLFGKKDYVVRYGLPSYIGPLSVPDDRIDTLHAETGADPSPIRPANKHGNAKIEPFDSTAFYERLFADGSEFDLRTFEPFPAYESRWAMIDAIVPVPGYRYWECRFCPDVGTEGELMVYNGDREKYGSVVCAKPPVRGFFTECMPGICFSYILAVREDESVDLIDSVEKLIEFMGPVDNIAEVLLHAKVHGYWYDTDTAIGGTYKEESDRYLIYLTEYENVPVSQRSVKAILYKDGTFEVLRKVTYKKSDEIIMH